MPSSKKKVPTKVHLHIENFATRPAIFQLSREKWGAAAKRHRALAKSVEVTFGLDGDILDQAFKTADALICSNARQTNPGQRAPRLRWIQTTGAGIDGLMPLDWLPDEVIITNNSGAHGAKCEEYCTMALLMLATGAPSMMHNQHARRWEQNFFPVVAGKTVVVVGFGDLGAAAGRAAKKLGLKVIAVTRSGKAGKPADVAYKTSRLDSVLPKADFVVIATPLTAETRDIMSRDRLALLKPAAGLINIGRAPLVDYDALREMLGAGKLAGAILDVHQPEPLPADSPLWTTPNVFVTPHVSCDYPEYVDRIYDRWFENLPRYLAGRPLKYTVDRKLGY